MAGQSINICFYGQRVPPRSILKVEPRWWDAANLCADSRFAKTSDSGSYLDLNAYLTVEEFIMIHEKFRPRSTAGVYTAQEWQVIIQPKLQAIDGALAGTLGKISQIHVQVAGWGGR